MPLSLIGGRNSTIHFDVDAETKASYVRAAQAAGKKLVPWIIEKLDGAIAMKTYEIDPRTNGWDAFSVSAGDHYGAAKLAAQKMWPRYRSVISVNRETGDGTGSGMFQAYTPAGNQRNSIVNMFHVAER